MTNNKNKVVITTLVVFYTETMDFNHFKHINTKFKIALTQVCVRYTKVAMHKKILVQYFLIVVLRKIPRNIVFRTLQKPIVFCTEIYSLKLCEKRIIITFHIIYNNPRGRSNWISGAPHIFSRG